jgi:transcriptional regulator with GAF, ATPase, and Fis domain
VVTQPEREQRVGEAFVALADTLVDDYDIIDLLDQLVAHCVALLAADAAGIMLADPREELRPVAASSEDAQTMELLQLQSEEGPCLEAYQSGAQVRIPDLSHVAQRWPRFVAAVALNGAFSSVHAIPLRLRGQSIGALNLLHREPGALPDVDLALAQALADVATIGILQERAIRRGEILNEQLQTALNSRVVIEQAKGVVAQHLGVGMDAAFDRLRRYCRANNLRLAQVARLLVARELDLAVLTAPPARSAPRSF